MKNKSDPFEHREAESRFIEHVERLLSDDRLRIETTAGRRAVPTLFWDVRKEDREVELKRLMSDAGVYDRQVQGKMPVGRELTVTLSRTSFWMFRKKVGRLKVICLSPWRDLLEGSEPHPMNAAELKPTLHANVEPASAPPTTLVVVSTGGFTDDARALVDQGIGRSLILVEPNAAGGWTVSGSVAAAPIQRLFDPEVDDDKRQRVRQEIANRRADLLSSGLTAAQISEATELPLRLVEDELKSYAKDGDGLVARKLEGNVVLFREGGSPMAQRSGGSDMPFIQRVKSLFGRKGDNEKKISLLAERRASLSVQRDRAFEEMGVLEQKEGDLRQQFKDTTSSITRRRVTSQLVQLRKDLERRQQLLGMLNQQINVVSTHLHNLELVQQGQSAALPNSEELAEDAAAAEEVIAQLQADNELAGSIGIRGGTGLSEEEQALYEELEREAAGPAKTSATAQANAVKTSTRIPASPEMESVQPPPLPPQRQRGEAEAG